MKITMTLSEISDRTNNWDLFCEETGISYWACNEGFGDTLYDFTIEQAKRYGLLEREQNEKS